MAMAVGSVSVSSGGTVTKSGMAEALYDGLVASMPADQFDTTEKKVVWANICTGLAAMVTYVTTNAEVVISTSTGDLQTSTGNGNPTNPPSTEQTLPVT